MCNCAASQDVFDRNDDLDPGNVQCNHLLGAAIKYNADTAVVLTILGRTTNTCIIQEAWYQLLIDRAPRELIEQFVAHCADCAPEPLWITFALRKEPRLWFWQHIAPRFMHDRQRDLEQEYENSRIRCRISDNVKSLVDSYYKS